MYLIILPSSRRTKLLPAKLCNLIPEESTQLKANAIFFLTDIAALPRAKPTCLAAHIKIILYFSLKPNGVRVLPVPVGAIYNVKDD